MRIIAASRRVGVAAWLAILVATDCGRAQTGDDILTDFILRLNADDVVPNPALDIAREYPEIASRMFHSPRPERERLIAYRLYVQVRGPGYKDLIMKALKDKSVPIRAAAVHDLPLAHKGDELITQYLRLFGDSSHWVRYNAAEALEKRPSPQAVEPLIKLLADPSIETRHRAANTLLRWKDPQVEKRLQESCKSPSLTVAGTANCALGRHRNARVDLPTVHRYLQQELKPRDAGIGGADHVVGIIKVLQDQGDASSLAVLEPATRHPHGSVQEAAREAIEAIRNRSQALP